MTPLPFRTSRRSFLTGGGAALLLAGCNARISASDFNSTTLSAADIERWSSISDEEWESRLSPLAFQVLRQEATERPYTSLLNDETRDGIYACAGCELPLFEAGTKYDSRTGWPSFYDFIPGSIGTKIDNKLWLPRTEYHCARCGGHQGHVFSDGPRPTGLRYCNNGVALSFIPA